MFHTSKKVSTILALTGLVAFMSACNNTKQVTSSDTGIRSSFGWSFVADKDSASVPVGVNLPNPNANPVLAARTVPVQLQLSTAGGITPAKFDLTVVDAVTLAPIPGITITTATDEFPDFAALHTANVRVDANLLPKGTSELLASGYRIKIKGVSQDVVKNPGTVYSTPIEIRAVLSPGYLDPAFSGDGRFVDSSETEGEMRDVEIAPNGDIITVGWVIRNGLDRFTMWAFSPSGTLKQKRVFVNAVNTGAAPFNVGLVQSNVSNRASHANGVTIVPTSGGNYKVYAVGWAAFDATNAPNDTDLAWVCYDSATNFSLCSDFINGDLPNQNATGVKTLDVLAGAVFDHLNAVKTFVDTGTTRLIAVGDTDVNGDVDMLYASVNLTGTFDTQFNGGGLLIAPGNNNDIINDVVVLGQGATAQFVGSGVFNDDGANAAQTAITCARRNAASCPGFAANVYGKAFSATGVAAQPDGGRGITMIADGDLTTPGDQPRYFLVGDGEDAGNNIDGFVTENISTNINTNLNLATGFGNVAPGRRFPMERFLIAANDYDDIFGGIVAVPTLNTDGTVNGNYKFVAAGWGDSNADHLELAFLNRNGSFDTTVQFPTTTAGHIGYQNPAMVGAGAHSLTYTKSANLETGRLVVAGFSADDADPVPVLYVFGGPFVK